ncbi:DNA-3-methyladenine glycosylase I [Candidatus Aerophobetes bacterium]|uniref:DNA-3-methyladenine glycosylase I n=1 Tax=Aerophobetes bacterium TaxID=2030807 RepID=A0A2A4X0L9_UNCAE|nr:MAG: DNA-3-methyladenine glycosylase I [Candidatus Aerophobetes bacterium]
MAQGKRCFGDGVGKEFYAHYHDTEWAKPCHDDTKLFEMLCLEGAQAGLSWETILKKREGYRTVFHGFNPETVANMRDEELEIILTNPAVVRNRLKIFSVRQNAHIFLSLQKEFGSFDAYLWAFVDNAPVINTWTSFAQVPASTQESDALSKDLKKRGMKFIGSTIIYAFMQAVGMVNDHLMHCPCRASF